LLQNPLDLPFRRLEPLLLGFDLLLTSGLAGQSFSRSAVRGIGQWIWQPRSSNCVGVVGPLCGRPHNEEGCIGSALQVELLPPSRCCGHFRYNLLNETAGQPSPIYGDSIEGRLLLRGHSREETAVLGRREAHESDDDDARSDLVTLSRRGWGREIRLYGQGIHGHPPGTVPTTAIHQVALSPHAEGSGRIEGRPLEGRLLPRPSPRVDRDRLQRPDDDHSALAADGAGVRWGFPFDGPL
jgi:hypothetical protein